jgi:hypothetical protein
MDETNKKTNEINQEGSATHSGWSQYYHLFSKYRDECLKLGQVVLGTNQEKSIQYLKPYVSSLYSMAQQIFYFYSQENEKEITEDWLRLVDEVNDAEYLTSDKDFRQQLLNEGRDFISKDLKLKLILFYNKIDRLAAEANLLVGKEDKSRLKTKKGLIGL